MPATADPPPLRCHLLIGPPASGKSTLAVVLAELTGATVLATDSLRDELFGDPAQQGHWGDVEQLLHRRLHEHVAARKPVILDATHTLRPWRLAITQKLELPSPVQWIAWWLTTPLEQCRHWNQGRQRQVDAAVIERMHANLPVYKPGRDLLKQKALDPQQLAEKLAAAKARFHDRKRSDFKEEGFAYVAAIDPSAVSDLHSECQRILDGVDGAILKAGNRSQGIKPHGYSRLLDLERLLFLIRLLLDCPGLELWDTSVSPPRESPEASELRRSFRFQPAAELPPPEASFADRAAFAVARRHGPCYGDPEAIFSDLQWLWEQGFVSALPRQTRIQPGGATPQILQAFNHGAGFPAAADQTIFQRQFGLLRHLIQNPFDHPFDGRPEMSEHRLTPARRARAGQQPPAANAAAEGAKAAAKARQKPKPLSVRAHLLARLQEIDGVSYSSTRKSYGNWDMIDDAPQVRTLDKDIETLIKRYGFLSLFNTDRTANSHDAT